MCAQASRSLLSGFGVVPDVQALLSVSNKGCGIDDEESEKAAKSKGLGIDVRDACLIRARLGRFQPAFDPAGMFIAAALCRLGDQEGCALLFIGWQKQLDAKGEIAWGPEGSVSEAQLLAPGRRGCGVGHGAGCVALAVWSSILPGRQVDAGAKQLVELCEQGNLVACESGARFLERLGADLLPKLSQTSKKALAAMPGVRDRWALTRCKEGQLGCGALVDARGLTPEQHTERLVHACIEARDFLACERAATRIANGEGAVKDSTLAGILATESCLHGWLASYQASDGCLLAATALANEEPLASEWRARLGQGLGERDRYRCHQHRNGNREDEPDAEMFGVPVDVAACMRAQERLAQSQVEAERLGERFEILAHVCDVSKDAGACKLEDELKSAHEAFEARMKKRH